jgi:hypothetical protein
MVVGEWLFIGIMVLLRLSAAAAAAAAAAATLLSLQLLGLRAFLL